MKPSQILLTLSLICCVLPVSWPADARPCKALRAMESVRIWKGTCCKATSVTLTPFLADGDGTAVIVCPGGSYFWLDEESEGAAVARWLQSRGISAFVLRYRTAGAFNFWSGGRLLYGGHRHPDMICDIQRAIQLVRENAEEYGIDPSRLGVMGFSAGGHLAMSAAEFFGTNFLSRYGIEPTVSLRPDFCAPVYPVVSFTEDCTHKRSRRGLMGEYRVNNKTLRDSLSLERHVRPDTPPVFLLNCKDDPVVDCRNSELLDSALTRAGVPHLYTRYEKGGHGFGSDSSRMGENTSGWQELFLAWLDDTLGTDAEAAKGANEEEL